MKNPTKLSQEVLICGRRNKTWTYIVKAQKQKNKEGSVMDDVIDVSVESESEEFISKIEQDKY